jgi:hypothetical protein
MQADSPRWTVHRPIERARGSDRDRSLLTRQNGGNGTADPVGPGRIRPMALLMVEADYFKPEPRRNLLNGLRVLTPMFP